jgi:hypothetical protein
MTAKKFIIALALLVGATSATLAQSSYHDQASRRDQGSRHDRVLYNYTGTVTTQTTNSYNPATSGYDPGAETQR